jgi:hypothetical protein
MSKTVDQPDVGQPDRPDAAGDPPRATALRRLVCRRGPSRAELAARLSELEATLAEWDTAATILARVHQAPGAQPHAPQLTLHPGGAR